MKKVDVICPYYINATVGPSTLLKRFRENKSYLKERGYEWEVFTYDFLASGDKDKAVDFSVGIERRAKIREWIRKNRFLSALFVLREVRQARRLVKRYATLNRTPDIVVFDEHNSCYSFMKMVKSQAKIALFFHNDGKRWEMFLKTYPMLKGSLILKYLNRRLEYVLNHLDKYVFIAKSGHETFLRENPAVAPDKTAFFHNGIDNLPLLPNTGDDCRDVAHHVSTDNGTAFLYRLCCTGTVCERKGQHLIIEALHLLDKSARAHIHLSLIGAGPDLAKLKEKVKQYRLEKNVRFEGNVPNEQIHEKLSNANIYILMSNNEGLPVSIIEGMRAGLAVISTRVAGIPEMVKPGYNGVLVEPNVASLLEVLKNISGYDWKAMGVKSRERFEKEFSFDKMKKAYCDMLDTLK